MSQVFILEAKRTPIGKFGGNFLSVSATSLAAAVIRKILALKPELKTKIDEVIIGNVLSAGLGQNPARIAAIHGGLNCKTPAYTVNKACGSGLKSVILGAQAIKDRESDVVIAGGMENMSQSPYLLENYRFGVKFSDQIIKDSMISDSLFCSLIGQHMGITAENIAVRYKIARKEQDDYALKSHQKAIKAILSGKLKDEIVPIELNDKMVINTDEQPRKNTSLEMLGKLKPVFKKNGTVTAGNSSSINDGAALVLLINEELSRKKRYKHLAKIINYISVGLNPRYMGLGSYYAAIKCLKKARMKISDIDLWEINEAFASQSIAVIRLLGVDKNKVNVNGGAIAFGHPIGASGTRILVSLLHEMKRRKLRFGMTSLCIGGGQGIAMLIERED